VLNVARPPADTLSVRVLTVVLAAFGLLAAVAPAAAASTGSCRGDGSGPTCRFWTGRAVSINDGDTIGVDIDGDGTHREYQVRFTGVQAMEQTRYSDIPSKRRGQCHALQATNLVERMIRAAHRRVRLAAQNPASRADRRLQRSVAVRIHGRWVDLGAKLMAAGDTLFMGSGVEWAWNRTYNRLGQQARLKGIGLWNPTKCGRGPAQDVPLKVWANWDPPGVDVQNLDGEWIRIQNTSPSRSVDLARWWVRDSMLRRFTFPRGTVLGPGRTATVHTGSGTRSGTTFYWGLHVTLFPNLDRVDLGDGAYLFDPKGDLRGAMIYPCLVACTDPNQGAVRITTHPGGHESVLVRNVSGRPVDLYGYGVVMPSATVPFDEGTVLAPGQAISVDAPGPGPILPDHGGSVKVATFSGIALACDAWGDGSC
jgi:endonuclease YncB( thermonuclease family)